MIVSKDSSRLWIYFFIFLLLSAFLAWVPLTVWQRLWLFPAGLFFSFLLAFRALPPARPGEKPYFDKNLFPIPSFWVWSLLAIAAVFLRLHHLADLALWPTRDDACNGSLGIELSEHWRWHWTFTSEQVPPLFFWLFGFFFKIVPPSLFSLWLYPALYSLLTVPLVYAAARMFFPRGFASLCAFLAAFSFWPLYYGRFCVSLGMINVAGELILVLLLGRFLKSRPKGKTRWSAFLLGLGVGAGFYLSTLFPLPAVFCSVVVWKACRSAKNPDWKSFGLFLSTALLTASPLAFHLFQNFSGGHLYTHLFLSGPTPSFARMAVTTFSYLTVFFFGPVDQSYWAYGPLEGGFLNPLLSSCFFIGVMEFSRFRKEYFFRWALAAFLFFLAPIFLFNTVELMRLILLMPFFILLTATGIGILHASLRPYWKPLFLALLFILSLTLDTRHLFVTFHRWSADMNPELAVKSSDRFQAYRILEKIQAQEGPGLVLGDFVSDDYDPSLLIGTYPFNAARNPSLSPEKARWAAVMADLHYAAFLHRRFPSSQEYVLSNPSAKNAQVLSLSVIPIATSEERATFQKWTLLNRALQDLSGEMPYHVRNPNFGPVLEKLLELYPRASEDPLLKAWILEKILDLLLVSPDATQALWFLNQPLEATRSFHFFDWKFAALYHRLGLGLVRAGRRDEARESFRRAAAFDSKYELKRWLALCRSED